MKLLQLIKGFFFGKVKEEIKEVRETTADWDKDEDYPLFDRDNFKYECERIRNDSRRNP